MRRLSLFILLIFSLQITAKTNTDFIRNAQLSHFFTLDEQSIGKMYISESGELKLNLKGKLNWNVKLITNSKELPLSDDREFNYELVLPKGSNTFPITLNFLYEESGPGGSISKSEVATFSYQWIKPSPLFKIQVQDKDQIIQKSLGQNQLYDTDEYLVFYWLDLPIRPPAPPKPPTWYDHFALGSVIAKPEYPGISVSPEIGFTPIWKLSEAFSLTGILSLSLYRYNPHEVIPVFSITPLLSYSLSQFVFALGPGIQSWGKKGGTHLTINAEVSYLFQKPILFVVERLYMGYSEFFAAHSYQVHELRAGLGLQF